MTLVRSASMNKAYMINIIIFSIGMASCLFVIFSISLRIIRSKLDEMKTSFLEEIQRGKIRAAHR